MAINITIAFLWLAAAGALGVVIRKLASIKNNPGIGFILIGMSFIIGVCLLVAAVLSI